MPKKEREPYVFGRGDPRTLGAQRRRLISCLRLVKQRRATEIANGSIPLDLLYEVGLDPFDELLREIRSES
jgi:hypothetical protein